MAEGRGKEATVNKTRWQCDNTGNNLLRGLVCCFTFANAPPSMCAPGFFNVSTPLYGKQSQTGRSCATWLKTNCVFSDKPLICVKKRIHIRFLSPLLPKRTVCAMSPEQLLHCLAERRTQTWKNKLSRALEGFTQHTLNWKRSKSAFAYILTAS